MATSSDHDSSAASAAPDLGVRLQGFTFMPSWAQHTLTTEWNCQSLPSRALSSHQAYYPDVTGKDTVGVNILCSLLCLCWKFSIIKTFQGQRYKKRFQIELQNGRADIPNFRCSFAAESLLLWVTLWLQKEGRRGLHNNNSRFLLARPAHKR